MFTNRKLIDRPNRRDRGVKPWDLRLYIADSEPRSTEARMTLNELCEQHLPGLYKIEVIDLTKHPARSREDEILALPTVVRRWPQPEKRVIGRLSDPEKVLAALELRGAQAPRSGLTAAISRRKHS